MKHKKLKSKTGFLQNKCNEVFTMKKIRKWCSSDSPKKSRKRLWKNFNSFEWWTSQSI